MIDGHYILSLPSLPGVTENIESIKILMVIFTETEEDGCLFAFNIADAPRKKIVFQMFSFFHRSDA